ncbi:hypothetical protein [Mucilaginibacter sp. SP1R1]|uniref:hypothetical protein n=1 Tax=Mucilaginibacter sp. SP1R1 TaxID=2723091 RepID=UPI003B0001AD
MSDLDKNGTIDPIVAYGIDQKYYTFLGKGEIERQVPLIKKKFLYYHDFAGKTVEQLFGDSLNDTRPLMAASFQSGVFYNQGKGNFVFKAFPASAQMTPIFGLSTFVAGHGKGILAGGNFSGVLPYEGRYDADYGDVLFLDGNRDLENIPPAASGFLLRGEVRDIKTIKTPTGIIYAVAFNNKPIRFFKLNK